MEDGLADIVDLFDSPVKCTTPEPAKSIDPMFRSGV